MYVFTATPSARPNQRSRWTSIEVDTAGSYGRHNGGMTAEMTWIFGHGSLMFRPGFAVDAARWGRVNGLERRYGHPSVRNWGSEHAPAPTACLVPGDGVDGLLLGCRPPGGTRVVDLLRRREAGEPTEVPVRTEDGTVIALTWPMRPSWAALAPADLARRARENERAGGGPSGTAIDYVLGVAGSLAAGPGVDRTTAAYLAALGVELDG